MSNHFTCVSIKLTAIIGNFMMAAVDLLTNVVLVLSCSIISSNALVIPNSGHRRCTSPLHNKHHSRRGNHHITSNRHRRCTSPLHKHHNSNHHITSTLSLPRGGESSKLFTSSNNSNNDDINDEDIKQQKKKLTKDFFSIAAPAFIQLAAEPLAGLVDTAYLGRLGPEVLGKCVV